MKTVSLIVAAVVSVSVKGQYCNLGGELSNFLYPGPDALPPTAVDYPSDCGGTSGVWSSNQAFPNKNTDNTPRGFTGVACCGGRSDYGCPASSNMPSSFSNLAVTETSSFFGTTYTSAATVATLHVNGCALTGTLTSLSTLGQGGGLLPNWSVDLSDNSLTGGLTDVVGNAKIHKLILRDNSLTIDATTILSFHNDIVQVDLEGNTLTNFNDNFIASLETKLMSSWPNLEAFNVLAPAGFNGNKCLDWVGVNAARQSKGYTVLDYDLVDVGLADCETIAPTLQPTTRSPTRDTTPSPTPAPITPPTSPPSSEAPTIPSPTRSPTQRPTPKETLPPALIRPPTPPRVQTAKAATTYPLGFMTFVLGFVALLL